jgi:hypothetical protein
VAAFCGVIGGVILIVTDLVPGVGAGRKIVTNEVKKMLKDAVEDVADRAIKDATKDAGGDTGRRELKRDD